MTDTPRLRGFQLLSPELRREIAAKGGRSGTGIKGVATFSPEKLAEVHAKALAARRAKKALTPDR